MLTYADVWLRMLTYAAYVGGEHAGGQHSAAAAAREVLSLLALLVQKYKYWHLWSLLK